jgi:hypothetical protein
MTDAADIWRQRKLEIESLLEQAQELERAAETHDDLPLDEIAVHFAHANNLRLRALCLDNTATQPVEAESAGEEEH